MKNRIIVLGAGMVGTCTALHLQTRGFEVILIDRRSPGLETSYGNAGLIQQEAVEPYAMPRNVGFLMKSALGLGAEVNWHANAMPGMLPSLWRYFKNSSAAKHALATQAYSLLTAHATSEHQPLIIQSQSEDLITRSGFRFVYRTQQAFDEGCERAARLHQDYGVRNQILGATALAIAEPALRIPLAGSVHWQDPWAVSDPGALVQRYAKLFLANGGQFRLGDANTLAQHGATWHIQTEDGELNAAQVVIALGPWSNAFVKKLGYSMPLFIKRGYHQHYKQPTRLSMPLLDYEKGYVIAPMQQGMRLTTGAEFAKIDAPSTPVQLRKAQALAHELIGLDNPLNTPPWLGARPCTADMLPIMGAAPHHKGMWFNFGHGHQGFTLGPISGRLLAEMLSSESTLVDTTPYSPYRF